MKLLLTSRGLNSEEMINSFRTFVGDKKEVTIITTASEIYKEKNRNAIALKNKLDALGFTVQFLDIENESPQLLKKAEIIIIGGGNPYYLLHHLKRTQADAVLREQIEKKVPVLGISAGGLIFMKDLAIIDLLTPEMNTIQLEDTNGMGLIEEVIIPHYDRFVKAGIINEEEIDAFEKGTEQQVLRLGENQWIKYEAGSFAIVGELMKE